MVNGLLPGAASLSTPVPGYGAPADPLSPELRGLAAKAGGPQGEELRRAARDFEAVFLRMLLGTMLPEDGGGLFGEGPSAGVVRGMFVDQIADGLADRRSLGIADLVEKTMNRGVAQAEGRPGAVPAPARPPSTGPKTVPVDLKV
jgi:flagellar protein FlgJ